MSTFTAFISYSRKDFVEAKRLFNDLQKFGLSIWMDEEYLLPGQKWKVEIKNAIRNCKYFLVLLSSNSVNKDGFVNKEIVEAIEILDEKPESAIYIIPVRLDDCKPSHEKLNEYQFVDLFPLWEQGVNRILRVLGVSILDHTKSSKLREKPKIFVSYCYEDKEFSDRIIRHLEVLKYEGSIELFYNANVKAERELSKEFQNVIDKTNIAILMLSSSYLSSSFIRNMELPYLLKEHKKENIQLFLIITKPCLWSHVKELSQIKVHPEDREPLSAYNEHQIDSTLVSIIEKVIEISTHNSNDNRDEEINYYYNVNSVSKSDILESHEINNDGGENDNLQIPPPPSELYIIP